MLLKITAEQLEKLDACGEGVREFKKLFGDAAEVEWTRDKQIEILKGPLKKYFGWAWQVGLIPMWSLQLADLQSANLQSADLQLADLQSANLQSADLQFANLQSANLQSADLQFANLRSANLQSADLQSADLQSADLQFANLRSADLRLANLQSAYVGEGSLYAELFRTFGWKIDNNNRLQKIKVTTLTQGVPQCSNSGPQSPSSPPPSPGSAKT